MSHPHHAVPTWHKRRRVKHARQKHERPHAGIARHVQRLTLCLWSANGEPVTRLDAFGDAQSAPLHCLHEQIRYDRVGSPANGARFVHYQTRTVIVKMWVA